MKPLEQRYKIRTKTQRREARHESQLSRNQARQVRIPWQIQDMVVSRGLCETLFSV
jgi:hypothetical protein